MAHRRKGKGRRDDVRRNFFFFFFFSHPRPPLGLEACSRAEEEEDRTVYMMMGGGRCPDTSKSVREIGTWIQVESRDRTNSRLGGGGGGGRPALETTTPTTTTKTPPRAAPATPHRRRPPRARPCVHTGAAAAAAWLCGPVAQEGAEVAAEPGARTQRARRGRGAPGIA